MSSYITLTIIISSMRCFVSPDPCHL